MNIVSIMGSPNGMEGNTGKLLSAVLDGVRESGAEVEEFCLQEMDVRPCDACEACHVGGTCVIDDDFETIKGAMIEADGVIFASPNYIRSVTAQMKALFDRCAGLLHVQGMEGKYGAAAVTSGGQQSLQVEEYIKGFIRSLGAFSTGSIGAAAFEVQDDQQWPEIEEDAQSVGHGLAEAIRREKTYPEQADEIQEFRERMRQVVMSRGEEWEFEYRYWLARSRAPR
jgi:multimeric flavodoxin WrbA